MKTERIEYIDLANVISTFAVVSLHANGVFEISVKKDIGLLQM